MVSAFEKISALEAEAAKYAKKFEPSANDPKVITHILSDHDNLMMLKDASMQFVQHEQHIVQPMYEKIYFLDGKKVGEVIHDASFVEKLIANKIEIAGAKILDKYISTDGYDFNNYDDRMAYFSEVFNKYFKVLAQPDGFEKLIAQREKTVSDIGVEFIGYGDHFQVNDGFNIYQDSFVIVWDASCGQWKKVNNTESEEITNGMWTPPETYPEVMEFINKYSINCKTIYFDHSSGITYLYDSADHLPDLPNGYMWFALKSYLQNTDLGYKKAGTLWTVLDTTTQTFSNNKKLDIFSLLDIDVNNLGTQEADAA